jgi:hypothetical protein
MGELTTIDATTEEEPFRCPATGLRCSVLQALSESNTSPGLTDEEFASVNTKASELITYAQQLCSNGDMCGITAITSASLLVELAETAAGVNQCDEDK